MSKKRIKRKKISRERINREEITQKKTSSQKIKLKNKRAVLKRRRQTSSRISSKLIPIIFGLIIVVIVGVILGSPGPGQNNGNPTQYQIPYSVTTIHDETIVLSTYQGKIGFFYFTGASCIPCQMQLPYIIDAYNYYKSTGKMEVFSLDIQGHTINDLLIWEQDNGITWKVCQDSGLTLATYFSIFSMPTLVVCDENGYELNRYIGAHDNETIWAIFESAIN